jgi:hypothetical protein
VAVHIVNAHLAKVANLHYRTHEDVKNAINPHNALAVCKIDEANYLAYAKLEMLSRRARYLCHDDPNNRGTNAHFTHDRHFAKAIRCLDKILYLFSNMYGITIIKPAVECQDLSKAENLKFFSVK